MLAIIWLLYHQCYNWNGVCKFNGEKNQTNSKDQKQLIAAVNQMIGMIPYCKRERFFSNFRKANLSNPVLFSAEYYSFISKGSCYFTITCIMLDLWQFNGQINYEPAYKQNKLNL